MKELPKYCTEKEDQPPFLKALAEMGRIAGHRHHLESVSPGWMELCGVSGTQ